MDGLVFGYFDGFIGFVVEDFVDDVEDFVFGDVIDWD